MSRRPASASPSRLSPSPPRAFRLARLLRPPAVRAMLLQCAAVPGTMLLAYLLDTFHVPVTVLTAALLQGTLASLLTYKMGLASWWRAIQLVFPAGLLAASALHLPPWVFLLLFLLLLGCYWSTFRTQVPYYPSNRAVWQAVLALLPEPATAAAAPRVIDIGSGLGGLVMFLARQRPDAGCTGIELAPLPWLYSQLRAAGTSARFLRGDYEQLDFSQFDLVFAYLSPAAMPGLWRKASSEMRPGTMLASYEFSLPEHLDGTVPARAPDRTIVTTAGRPPLYVWYF